MSTSHLKTTILDPGTPNWHAAKRQLKGVYWHSMWHTSILHILYLAATQILVVCMAQTTSTVVNSALDNNLQLEQIYVLLTLIISTIFVGPILLFRRNQVILSNVYGFSENILYQFLNLPYRQAKRLSEGEITDRLSSDLNYYNFATWDILGAIPSVLIAIGSLLLAGFWSIWSIPLITFAVCVSFFLG